MFTKALFMTSIAIAAQVANAAPPAGPVHAIAIVDIKPTHAAPGTVMLTAFVARLRHAPGVTSVALIQLDGSVNHFIVDAQYASAAAYQNAIESADVVTFRRDMYQHLGGPWDERVGRDAAP